MKVKRFDFNFKPLQLHISLAADGSVPDRQNYDADTDAYTPDYTLTPLIIQPAISRLDKDEVLQAGRVNHLLANIKWYEIIAGTRTLIEAANTNYEVVTSGDKAGRIKVKKNAQPQIPITLEFNADYTDTKTQMVHASLRLGENECAAAKRAFVWEKFREDNTWTAVGTDTTLDYDVTVAADGTSVVVDRSLMGEELYLRCRAKYDPDGNPGGVTLTDASPAKIVSFIRRIPKFEYDIMGVPTNIPAGLLAIAPEAAIWNTKGPIANPERELLPLWYVAPNRASGSLSYSQIGHGVAPTLSTKAMTDLLGGVYGLDVKDCGPTCAWEDSDGKVFEDSDGAVLLIK